MECDPTIPHDSLTTSYKKGCRGDVCRADNAAQSRAWRARQAGFDPACGNIYGGNSSDLNIESERAVTLDEFEELRGYDRLTRTYAEAS